MGVCFDFDGLIIIQFIRLIYKFKYNIYTVIYL